MSIILTPFAKLLLLFYDLTGSYGVSLILFGLVIRLILFPIFLKGRKGMLSMSGLAEKQKVLQQKYARDRVKYSQELQRLYEEEGVKPSSGCLWSFLPLPFLMVLYAIVRQPLTYLLNMTQDQFNVVSNLLYGNVLDYRNQQLQMAQDVFLNHDKIVAAVPELANMPQIDFTFLGVNLSQTPHFMFWKADDIGAAFGLWLIPVISAALGVVSMIVTNHINGKVLGTRRTMDQSTRMTMFIMPLFSLWICFTLPAALGVYWIANSLFAMLQEVLNIPFLRSFLKKQEEAKVKRWQAIAESAAKQSKRSLVPRVSGIMTLKEAFDYVESQGFSVRLIPYEHEAGMDGTKTELDAAGPGQDIAVFIGPEGGFDEREIELALSKGVRPISLGRRILRTETAGLALLSVLMMRLEGAL